MKSKRQTATGPGTESRRPRRQAGQALVEFMIVAGLLISMLVMLSLFLYTFRAYGNRVLQRVASEFP